MHFDDKYERWIQEFIDADEAWLSRRQSGQPMGVNISIVENVMVEYVGR